MRQKLLQTDTADLRRHLAGQLREDVRDRRIPPQLAFFDQHRGEQRGHRLGVGADMKPVVYCDRDVRADPPCSDRAGRDDRAVLDHGGGESGQVVLCEIRLKHAIK